MVSSESPSVPPARAWYAAFAAVAGAETVSEVLQARIFRVPSEGDGCFGGRAVDA